MTSRNVLSVSLSYIFTGYWVIEWYYTILGLQYQSVEEKQVHILQYMYQFSNLLIKCLGFSVTFQKKYENRSIHFVNLPFLMLLNRHLANKIVYLVFILEIMSSCFDDIVHGDIKRGKISHQYCLMICQYGKVLHSSNIHNIMRLWRSHIINLKPSWNNMKPSTKKRTNKCQQRLHLLS